MRAAIGILLVVLGLWLDWLVVMGKRLWFEPGENVQDETKPKAGSALA